jgi:hypothetical protein
LLTVLRELPGASGKLVTSTSVSAELAGVAGATDLPLAAETTASGLTNGETTQLLSPSRFASRMTTTGTTTRFEDEGLERHYLQPFQPSGVSLL